jgi:hypothetical protein
MTVGIGRGSHVKARKGAGARLYMKKIFFPIYENNSPGFFLNMKTISVFEENFPLIFHIFDINLRNRV